MPPTHLVDQVRATSWFCDLEPELWQALAAQMEEVRLDTGAVLFRKGEQGDALYYLVTGTLEVWVTDDDGQETPVNVITAGKFVGEIQLLVGGLRTATLRAYTPLELVRIRRPVFEQFIDTSPLILQHLIDINHSRVQRTLLVDVLKELFGNLDSTAINLVEYLAEWVELQRGEVLFEQGDPSDSLYLVVQGRLSAVFRDERDESRVIAEFGRAESVGEMGLLTGSPRTATVRAVRDCKLVRYSQENFETIASHYPQVNRLVVRTLVDRLARLTRLMPPAAELHGDLRTIAIIPCDERIPLTEFSRRLASAMATAGQTLHLNRRRLAELSGLKANIEDPHGDPARLRLGAWLEEQEARYPFVLYEADPDLSEWTRKCLRQADHILAVTWSDRSPHTSQLMETLRERGGDELLRRTSLVIVHPDAARRPEGTAGWRAALGVNRHHHVRWEVPADVARLGRLMSGSAVGLVLGGGGARAFSHIGVIGALEEAGVPIDMVGGTSLGSLVGAQYAFGYDAQALVELNRAAFLAEKPERDITLPYFGLIRGHRGERIAERFFHGSRIEDLWLNFFAVSANLSTARQVIHQEGPLATCVRASMAIPGAFVPVVSGTDLLVDGGLLNNVPVDVMRSLGAGRVIAVDVSPSKDLTVRVDSGQLPSATRMLMSTMHLAPRPEAPGLFDILMRAGTLGSVERAEQARLQSDLYIVPPLEKFGTFGLKSLAEIVEIGYQQGRKQVQEWLAEGQRPVAERVTRRILGPPRP